MYRAVGTSSIFVTRIIVPRPYPVFHTITKPFTSSHDAGAPSGNLLDRVLDRKPHKAGLGGVLRFRNFPRRDVDGGSITLDVETEAFREFLSGEHVAERLKVRFVVMDEPWIDEVFGLVVNRGKDTILDHKEIGFDNVVGFDVRCFADE